VAGGADLKNLSQSTTRPSEAESFRTKADELGATAV